MFIFILFFDLCSNIWLNSRILSPIGANFFNTIFEFDEVDISIGAIKEDGVSDGKTSTVCAGYVDCPEFVAAQFIELLVLLNILVFEFIIETEWFEYIDVFLETIAASKVDFSVILE